MSVECFASPLLSLKAAASGEPDCLTELRADYGTIFSVSMNG